MKIKILVGAAGLGRSYAPGDVVDLPNDKAQRWIAARRAQPVLDIRPPLVEDAPLVMIGDWPLVMIETAEAAPAPEVAVVRRGRPRKFRPMP